MLNQIFAMSSKSCNRRVVVETVVVVVGVAVVVVGGVVVVGVVVCSLHYTKPVRVWRCAALADGMVVVVVVILVKVRVRCCSPPHPIPC